MTHEQLERHESEMRKIREIGSRITEARHRERWWHSYVWTGLTLTALAALGYLTFVYL